MRHPNPVIGLGLFAVYFSSVAFAVAALWPPWAIPAGLLAATLALVVYAVLVLTDHDAPFVVGLLFVLPTICMAAGAVWWVVVRGLGFWRLRP